MGAPNGGAPGAEAGALGTSHDERADCSTPADEAVEDLEVQIAEIEAKEAEAEAFLSRPEFEATADGYRLRRPGIELEVEHIKRASSGELRGEVLARTWIPGSLNGGDGVLAVDYLNLSSARTRKSFARYLEERSRLKEFDWVGLLESFGQQVIAAERRGEPSVLLTDLERPGPDEALEVLGIPLLRRHPLILFGDGGTCKSYAALYFAGTLNQRGLSVGFFDWELAGEDHRERLSRLFGADLPVVHYARCSRPLVYEAERLRRIVREQQLDYVVLDSIAFACDGPPENAEQASRYFQSLRRLGEVGSTNIAHITKGENADRRPFGSTFWFNGCRSCWNVKRSEGIPDESLVQLAFHHRKANTGGLRRSLGLELQFDSEHTRIRRLDLSDAPDLAAGLSIRQRMALALRKGPLSPEVLAEEVEAKPETVKRLIRRHGHTFTLIDGGLVSLLERRP